MSSRLNCAISYSHADLRMCNKFKKHLEVLSRTYPLNIWCDMKIMAGQNLDDEIKENFKISDIIFLLISNDFVSSYYCFEKELQIALERHNNKKSVVIPVILSEVATIDTLPFGKLMRVPQDGKAITRYKSHEAGFSAADKMIKTAIENFSKFNIKQDSNANKTIAKKQEKKKSTVLANSKTLTYTIVKNGKITNINMTQQLIKDFPDYCLNTAKFSKSLDNILNMVVSSYEQDYNKKRSKQRNTDARKRLKYFRSFLFEVANAVLNNYIGNVNTRVHFRRLNGDVYEGLVVSGASNDKTAAQKLTVMPSQKGMIFLSGTLSMPLIRSLNQDYHQKGNNDDVWVEHLTCTFKENSGEKNTILSMGISLNKQTFNHHKNTLRLMAYTRMDLLIEQCINDFISRCQNFDKDFVLSNFITANFY